MSGQQKFVINDYRRLAFGCQDTAIMSVVKSNGPVVVNINDHDPIFKHYKSGIIQNLMPNIRQTTHSVVLIGWGTEGGNDYWLIRNSWGANWGDHGFVKIGRHHSLMGLNNQVVYPILH